MKNLFKFCEYVYMTTETKPDLKISNVIFRCILYLMIVFICLSFLITTSHPPHYSPEQKKCSKQIDQLILALEHFHNDTGTFPETLPDLIIDPGVENWNPGGYLDLSEIPLDAWDNNFRYINFASGSFPIIISAGPDGDYETADVAWASRPWFRVAGILPALKP